MDLALNNLQWLMCHKTKPNQIEAYQNIHLSVNGSYSIISTFWCNGYCLGKWILRL